MSTWMAILALLMAALAPRLSHAVDRSAIGEWMEICSAAGARMVRVDGAGTTAPGETGDPSLADAMAHCPYCLWQAQTPALPPAAAAGLPIDTSGYRLPELFLAAPRTLFAWASIQPRGPPTVS